jgi:hypothetical protein
MSNKNSVLGNFEFISNMIQPNKDGSRDGVENTDYEGLVEDVDPEVLEEMINAETNFKDKPVIKGNPPTDDDEGDKLGTKKEVTEEETEEEDEDEEGNEEDTSTDTDGEAADLSEFESDILSFFKEKLTNELDWEFTEDDKIESVSDLVKYMDELVTTASVPTYASDEVAKYDEYVRNGGNLKDFYDKIYSNTGNIKDIDLSDETNQKSVVRSALKLQGIKEEAIDRRIKRFEDAGVLEEEALDATEYLEKYKEENEQRLLQEQQEKKVNHEKQQRDFITNVEKTVNNLTDIVGTKVSESKKKELLEYIFKTDSKGLTQQHKEYLKDPVMNLIKAAYFQKEGENLFNKVNKKAASDTALNLKNKISASKDKRIKGGSGNQHSKNSFDFSSLSSVLLGK